MDRDVGFVVGLVVLGALFALAVQVARLRARGLRQERAGAELSRTLATVQGWAAQELRALRDEFTVARVDASAAVVLARRAQKSTAETLQAPEVDDDEQRDMVAMPAPETPTAELGDEEATSVLDRAPLAHPDLIGCEDIAEEARYAQLGHDEQTPPRHGRAALLLHAYQAPEKASA